MAVLKEEDQRGLRSCVMVFNRRHDRALLRRERELAYTEYAIDWPELQRLERERGFVVGYHCNAVEQALWDADRAQARFEADVAALRRRFDVRFFSPHGGVTGPNGVNNFHVRVPQALMRDIRWVANSHSVTFDGYYSDGAASDPKRDLTARDLRDFVRSWQPGRRYRVLTHPQYYGGPGGQPKHLFRAKWYREILALEDPTGRAHWADVEVGSTEGSAAASEIVTQRAEGAIGADAPSAARGPPREA
jgi:hypothetical protein